MTTARFRPPENSTAFLNVPNTNLRPQSEVLINGILDFYAQPPSPEILSSPAGYFGTHSASWHPQRELGPLFNVPINTVIRDDPHPPTRLVNEGGRQLYNESTIHHKPLPVVPTRRYRSEEVPVSESQVLSSACASDDWNPTDPAWSRTPSTPPLSSQWSKTSSPYSITTTTDDSQSTHEDIEIPSFFMMPKSVGLPKNGRNDSSLVSTFDSDDEKIPFAKKAVMVGRRYLQNRKNGRGIREKNFSQRGHQAKGARKRRSCLTGLASFGSNLIRSLHTNRQGAGTTHDGHDEGF